MLFKRTQIHRKAEEQGESIEEMLRRATANKEPISGEAPMIYTPKADGVRPEFDIRTDRQELALDATDKFSKSERAKTETITAEDVTIEPINEPKKE